MYSINWLQRGLSLPSNGILFETYFQAICNEDTMDWKTQNTKKIVRNIVKNVEPGDIILMHDVFPTSVEAALEAIDLLTKEGYTFVTADELLID